MNGNRERTEGRARKLLALIQDEASTESEVFCASVKLQSLLKETGMTVADIEASDDALEVTEDAVLDASRLDPWRVLVAKVVARAYRCKVFTAPYRDGWTATGKRRNRVRIMFMGYAQDVELAGSVYSATCAAAENCWNAERPRVTQEYRSMTYDDRDPWIRNRVRAARRDYLAGFANGLNSAYLANERADSELALAVAVPKAVTDRYEAEVTGKPRHYDAGHRESKHYLRGAVAGCGVGSGDRLCA